MEKREKPLNIMFVSHTYIGGPFVVGSHHLAREFSKRGHRVLHLSTSVTPLHLLQMYKKSVKSRFKHWLNTGKTAGEQSIIHCVPFTWVPWKLAGNLLRRRGRNWFVSFTAFPSLSKMFKLHRFQDVDLLFIDQPCFAGIDRYLNAKAIVYRPTDNYADMLGDGTVEWAEKDIVGRAHGIVATSGPVYQNIRKYRPELPGMILENGVEFEHFAKSCEEPTELKDIPRPRAIYIGAVDDRLDLDAIRELAVARPELSVIIIGPHTTSKSTATLSNLFFMGAHPYASLPSFLHHADLALLPMSDHAANAGRSPMKLYEYAAAGLPTVVTATAELLRRTEDFLFFYKEKHEFIEQVDEVLRKIATNGIVKERIIEAARMQSWEAKAELLLTFGLSLANEEARSFRGA